MKRLFFVCLLWLSGCVLGRAGAIQQASFDYKCDEEKIHVVRMGPNNQSAELDVCGLPRTYHQLSPPTEGIPAHWAETPTAPQKTGPE